LEIILLALVNQFHNTIFSLCHYPM